MCVFRRDKEYVGATGNTSLSGIEALGKELEDAFHSGVDGYYWHCKAYGPEDWGKTKAPDTPKTGLTMTGYIDYSFAMGDKDFCPIISNVLGNGTRACMFSPSRLEWYGKSAGVNYWGCKPGSFTDPNPDDHIINMVNTLPGVKAGAHTGLYMNLQTTPFWPLNYRPEQPGGGDYLSFVDMSTFDWYINWNPKRV